MVSKVVFPEVPEVRGERDCSGLFSLYCIAMKEDYRVEDWISGEGVTDWVSVIIPVHNRERLVLDALNSVERQIYRPIEIVVVNDGSDDESGAVVRRWSQQFEADDTFSVRCMQQENAGAPVARNKGARASKGQYLLFLDSDDLLLPEKIAEAVDLFRTRTYNIVYSKTKVVTPEGRQEGTIGRALTKEPQDIAAYCWHTSGPVYKRSALQEVGPWLEELTGNQDWEYGARVKLGDFAIGFIDQIQSVYRKHTSESVSRPEIERHYTRSSEMAYDSIVALARDRSKFSPPLATRMARMYFYRAMEYLRIGCREDGLRCLAKAETHSGALDIVSLLAAVCKMCPYPSVADVVLQGIDVRNRLAAKGEDQ